MKLLYRGIFFYEPGCIAAIEPPLRRTLLRFVRYAAICEQHSKKYFTFIFIFSIISFSSASQKYLYDSSSVTVRSFSDSSVNALKSNPDFQYEKMTEPPQSLWARFWDWIWNKIDSILSTTAGTVSFWTVLLIFAVGAIIIFIRKTNGMGKSSIFSRTSVNENLYAAGNENIHEISFEKEINKAVETGNFRLAIRLLYLETLKILSDRSFIRWDENKTDYAYIKEMEGRPQQPMFANLTSTFEHAWYGNNYVSEIKFQEIQDQFKQFKQL